MTNDPRAALAAALTATEPEAPLTALRYAVSWTAQTLPGDIGDDDVVAMRCVIELDQALGDLNRLLAAAPAIVAVASPGRMIEERITGYRDELARRRADLAADRAALDTAGDLERQVREAETERNELAVRIGMLQRQRQLAIELPDLRTTLAALQQGIDQATAEAADDVATGLVAAVQRLADLTEEQRSLMGEDLSRLAAETTEAAEKLAGARKQRDDLAAEITARLAEAEQLQREYQEKLPALREYQQADQALAAGLSAAGIPGDTSAVARIQETLGEIASRLEDLDSQLTPLLTKQAQQYEHARRVRPWSRAGEA